MSAGVLLAALLAAPIGSQVTERVSVDSLGSEGDRDSSAPSLSADGRYVAFTSFAGNLVSGNTSSWLDVFVRDRKNGTTECVSVDPLGSEGYGDSNAPSISADGRYVAFTSFAGNLVGGDTRGYLDVFVRDRLIGATERLSIDSFGSEGNGDSFTPSVSADGRYVAFWSVANNLVSGDTNGFADVFVRDRQGGTTERVSVDSLGAQAHFGSGYPSLSADGRYVAFLSRANNLVAGDLNRRVDVFVHDRVTATTERVSVDSLGAGANGDSLYPSISADGRYVAFSSYASNLVKEDTNRWLDVFVRDRLIGTTERVSVDSLGAEGDGWSWSELPSVSAGGRYVVFASVASNLVAGDTNEVTDVFVRDRRRGTTERVSVESDLPSISTDGRYAAFASYASNLVGGDTNGVSDVFLRETVLRHVGEH